MPATANRTDPLPFRVSDVSNAVIRASLESGRVWTGVYLEGLEATAEVQRGIVRDTPLEPLAGVLTAQAQVSRQIVDAYLTLGDRVLGASREATERAGETGAKIAERVGSAVEKTAKKQAEIVTGPTEEPIPGYDSLTAEQVVAKLPELPQSTLAKVAAYERAHQARTTVLGRVDSLSGDEPAPGYDDLTVAAVQELLREGDAELATRVRDYERTHKGRTGVIEAAERQLEQS